MEIVLKDLSCRFVKTDQILKHVDYVFKDNNVTFCSGLSGKLLCDLLFLKKKQSSGYILVNTGGRVSDIGYIGNDPKKEFNSKIVKEEMYLICSKYNLAFTDIEKRINDALLLAGLDSSFSNRVFSSLSFTEQKKVMLALVLFYNPKVIIIDYFEKGLNYKDVQNFKKLLSKLKIKYKKNIIICGDNLDKYLDIVDSIVVFNKGVLKFSGCKNDLYNDTIYKYIECPLIIKFIKYCNKKGHKLLEYTEFKELIKAIYRDVEAK